MISDVLLAIGQQIDAYHAQNLTTTEFRVLIDNGVPKFYMAIPALGPLVFEFKNGADLAVWLADVNADIDPQSSAAARQRLETLKVEQIQRDAEILALEKTVVDLPDTQLILDAKAEAAARIAAANDKLAILTEQLSLKESEAVAAEKAVADAEAVLSVVEAPKG